MSGNGKRDGVEPKDAGRRALLKAATVAGGAVAASALLPGSWRKPVATVGGLPAHAQTSQTISLSRPSASVMDVNGARGIGGEIEARCAYEDALGDFDATHQVTFTVTLRDIKAATGVSEDCGTAFTRALKDIPHKIVGDGSAGELYFVVTSACMPPGAISWHIHKGAHTSNVVKATVKYPDF